MGQILQAVYRIPSGFFSRRIDISRFINVDLKRVIDITLSLPLILFCLCLIPLVAILVKYKSKGSLFYHQQRYGLNKKPFTIYKLQTMHQHLCDDGSQQAIADDVRVSPAGKWLRHFSIDELPQLYNVLIGDMSLIGPRPHAVNMDDYYRDFIMGYEKRYQIKPGITGLAQIKGHRGETKMIQDMERRINYDIEYIQKQSLGFDLLILFRTIWAVLRPAC